MRISAAIVSTTYFLQFQTVEWARFFFAWNRANVHYRVIGVHDVVYPHTILYEAPYVFSFRYSHVPVLVPLFTIWQGLA